MKQLKPRLISQLNQYNKENCFHETLQSLFKECSVTHAVKHLLPQSLFFLLSCSCWAQISEAHQSLIMQAEVFNYSITTEKQKTAKSKLEGSLRGGLSNRSQTTSNTEQGQLSLQNSVDRVHSLPFGPLLCCTSCLEGKFSQMSHPNCNLWLLTQPNSTKQQLSCSPGLSSGWLLWDIPHLPLDQTRQAPLPQPLLAAHVQLAAITS